MFNKNASRLTLEVGTEESKTNVGSACSVNLQKLKNNKENKVACNQLCRLFLVRRHKTI